MKKFIFLMLTFLISALGFSQELVTNGNFQTGNGSGGWAGNALNVVDLGGGNFVNQANVTSVGNPWDVNLSYVLPLTQGKTYKLKFDAWTDNATGNRIMTAGIGLNQDPWTNINDPAVALTSTQQTFTYTWVCPATNTNSRIIFDMGNALGYVFIDNVSLTEVVTNVPAPSTAAPTPPGRPVADVVSVFSDAYNNISVNQWGPDWGPTSSRINDTTIAGNATKVMAVAAGQDFAGISFIPSLFDATPFTHFHMDYWIASPIPTGQVINIKLSNHIGGGGETNAIIATEAVSAANAGQWVSLDIPLANFTYAGGSPNGTLDRTAIAEIVLIAARADLNVPVNIYFDNMYFHKNTLGVKEVVGKNKLVVYPNPVNSGDLITVKESVKSLELIDMNGRKVKSSSNSSISSKDLDKGIYLIKVTNNKGEISTTQVIVK